MRRTMLALVAALAVTVPLGADVTIVQTTTGKGGPIGLDGESTSYLKGARMRVDSRVKGKDTTTIIDLEKQQFIALNHEKKEAEVTDMSAVAKSLQVFKAEDIKARVTPTGNKKQILGYAAQEYEMAVALPFQPPKEGGGGAEMSMAITMGGPVWVSKEAPGFADFEAFYRAAADKGLFFTDPRAAKASPGQAKGMVELYRQMAKAGVPLVSQMEIKFEGGGPMAGLMSKMGGANFVSTVTKITTDAIEDAKFEIPAGYKVKQTR